jgi:hypothetical protein
MIDEIVLLSGIHRQEFFMSVRLYTRIRLENGSRQYVPPVFSANGKPKPFYALTKGKPEHHPEGVHRLFSRVEYREAP